MWTLRRLPAWLLIGWLLLACSADLQDGAPRSGTSNAIGAAAGTGPSAATLPVAGSRAAGNPTPSVDTRPIEDSQCAAISQTAQNQLQPADVVWAIDNSGSMSDEIAFVRANMNAFSHQIAQSGVDVHIVLVSATWSADPNGDAKGSGGRGRGNGLCIEAPLGSGSCPNDSKLPVYQHVAQTVGSQDALDMILSTYAQYAPTLRPSATKSFVVVTDDDAVRADMAGALGPAMRSAAFMSSVKALDPTLFTSFKVHGIYAFTKCAQAAAVGQVYTELANATGGLRGDLCLQDFKPVFDELARGIVSASRVDCEWAIPAPQGQAFDVGKVNVRYATAAQPAAQTVLHVDAPAQCPASGGWFYDDNSKPTHISVCPATCDAIRADPSVKFDILFGCPTLVPQ